MVSQHNDAFQLEVHGFLGDLVKQSSGLWRQRYERSAGTERVQSEHIYMTTMFDEDGDDDDDAAEDDDDYMSCKVT